MSFISFIADVSVSFLTLALYILFLVGIPYVIAYAIRSISSLTKYKKKADKIFWISFIALLAMWNALIFILEIVK